MIEENSDKIIQGSLAICMVGLLQVYKGCGGSAADFRLSPAGAFEGPPADQAEPGAQESSFQSWPLLPKYRAGGGGV